MYIRLFRDYRRIRCMSVYVYNYHYSIISMIIVNVYSLLNLGYVDVLHILITCIYIYIQYTYVYIYIYIHIHTYT